ncbi:S9 family peptidase [Cytophagaceae bacterium YF14B1]|uniref:S9 family peptidase n=1 Tax=Xanthocytophaga flava TaxID=3048013 RepID=A0AAE3QXG6_9BACT|nr:S9 family peptidase [Xanthocytophaga flavus]MDJ1484283.1 S9 family peptidase [Xanthocytophaga flavus]
MKKLFLTIVCTFHLVLLLAQNGTEKVLMTDLLKIKQAGNIALSPDGNKAVYTVTSIEPDADNKDDYKYNTQLFLTDLNTNTQQLTRGESIRQPVWSPDGRKIAFVRTVKGKGQVFVLPLDGGEAFQLTQSKYSVSNPQWAPDGKQILVAVSLPFGELLKDSLFNPTKQPPSWSLEKPGFTHNEFVKLKDQAKPNPDGSLEEIRAYLNKDVEDKKAKVINRLTFQGESTTEPELNFNHLAVVALKENATLTPLTKGFYSFGQASWTPDGKQIIYVANGSETEQHPDRDLDSRIFVMNADGSNYKLLLGEKGKRYSSPVLSGDGKTLAFQLSASEGLNIPVLATTALGVGNASVASITFDRNAGNLKFSSDNKFLYFSAQSNGGQPVYRYDLKTKKIDQLSDYTTGITDFDISKNKIVYARTEIVNPSEVYLADASLKSAKLLTDLNVSWLKNKRLSLPEKHTLTNDKGQTIEYWIMKPTFVESGKKYPLLLEMHGGPTAMWGPGEQSMWHEFQFFCSKGYGIVYANPRGSGGYGLDFMKANYRDWGTGPASDVLSATTAAAKESWVDTTRQVITGGSYAGYLTAWIVGHDNRFKAAFAQRGVYDLTTFMGEGNAWRLTPNYFGYPWEAQKVLDDNSPLTFVTNIKTPLLIKHGENDLRTGVIQSEMLYKSLKILGRDVEYVRMPGATHELSRSGNVRQRIDRMLRIYEFMERYIGDKKQP